MELKKYPTLNIFFISLFGATVLFAENNKVPIDLEKSSLFMKKDEKFWVPINSSKARSTPRSVKEVFLKAIDQIKVDSSKNVMKNSKMISFEPQKFGPIFCLLGKDGFDVYFLKVDIYNNIMGLPFDRYYFVIFNKKTNQCSEKAFSIEDDFSDCYWDNLPNDQRAELVIDHGYRNGTGHYFEKTYYEVKSDLTIKELFVLYRDTDGDNFSEQKIVKKMKGRVVVEDSKGNSETGTITDTETEEIKFEF